MSLHNSDGDKQVNQFANGLLTGLGAAVAALYFGWCLVNGIQRDQEYLEANDARIEREIERRAGWSN
jgi:hypothetical protein